VWLSSLPVLENTERKRKAAALPSYCVCVGVLAPASNTSAHMVSCFGAVVGLVALFSGKLLHFILACVDRRMAFYSLSVLYKNTPIRRKKPQCNFAQADIHNHGFQTALSVIMRGLFFFRVRKTKNPKPASSLLFLSLCGSSLGSLRGRPLWLQAPQRKDIQDCGPPSNAKHRKNRVTRCDPRKQEEEKENDQAFPVSVGRGDKVHLKGSQRWKRAGERPGKCTSIATNGNRIAFPLRLIGPYIELMRITAERLVPGAVHLLPR